MESSDKYKVSRDFKDLKYHAGFGNHFESEAIKDTLPKGMNSPQKCPLGLYNEQTQGTSFTLPRSLNLRSFQYRIKPSVVHKPPKRVDKKDKYSKIKNDFFNPENLEVSYKQLRWRPVEEPKDKQLNWVESLITIAGSGDPTIKQGVAIYLYGANSSMENKAFYSADGDLLIVPQKGTLYVTTEFGKLALEPIEIVVIPRGIKFSIDISEFSRGYVVEVFKGHFRLPDLGPIGSNGLANPRDFQTPTAWYEDVKKDFTVTAKYGGNFFEYEMDHSPFTVVAWHGNYYPYKYDLRLFNTIGSVSYDHADPSIFTVLTSPTDELGVASCDFVLFPPRWEVQENTFRPPWFHRNTMSEFNGYIWAKDYEETEGGFFPGTSSLNTQMIGHGVDSEAFEKFANMELKPFKFTDSFAFMFETTYLLQTTKFAFEDNLPFEDAWQRWQGLKNPLESEKPKPEEK